MEKATGRNSMDVVMELVEMHLDRLPLDQTRENLDELYTHYFKLVRNTPRK
ncbi:hypothetical protein SAMN05421839_1393 [Halolactibacillus halophilus]|uniref:Uncharacterized protein n=1 Tax=Halolactibacillus halophilus TaxID=306540 RepID=A0A1I5S4L5_9BACI|nr:hypothetical protein [Halolactibacillus halophilus]GEM02959.1 hypothetical protein HHA03_24910 [Halolactibacillus halophilus]SFP65541.1 hypothetical protein SAMN05421839_1393 [Halolactibacillus halophilus]